MATIYRFIVEQKATGGGGRKSTPSVDKKTPSKKGKVVSLFGGEKGGVEHNRKFRAINPLLNKMTGGWWEKGTRLGRAGMGLVKVNAETGAFAGLSGVAIAIILAFAIQMLLKYQQKQINYAEQQNTKNFKRMENGVGTMNSQYEVSQNMWTGALTYNQNK